MSSHTPSRPSLTQFRHQVGLGLSTWLGLGLLAMLMMPATRGFNEWIGWLPFWLLCVPGFALLVLRRHDVLARLRQPADDTRAPRRRNRRQARRAPVRARPLAPLRAGLAALLLR